MLQADTPMGFLGRWERRYPECISAMVPGNANSLDAWVDLLGSRYYMESRTARFDASVMAAISLWRRERRLFLYDGALASVLCQQGDDLRGTDVLPLEILHRLPAPCIYIKVPGAILSEFDGFFAWVDTRAATLHLLFLDTALLNCLPASICLGGSCAVQDCASLRREDLMLYLQWASMGCAMAESMFCSPEGSSFRSALRQAVFRALQLLFYLLSTNAEVDPPSESQKTSEMETRVFRVGEQIGKALRTIPSGKERRAHTRRGHLHRYWTGPKNDPEKRTLQVKWIAPVMVGGKGGTPVVDITYVTEEA